MVLLNVYSTVVDLADTEFSTGYSVPGTSKFSETAVLRPSINITDVLNLVLIVNLVSIVV